MVTLVGCVRGIDEMGAQILGCLHPKKEIKTCAHPCSHDRIHVEEW